MKGQNNLLYTFFFITTFRVVVNLNGHFHVHLGTTNFVGGKANGAFEASSSPKLPRKILPEGKSETESSRENKRAKLSAPPPPPPPPPAANQNRRSNHQVSFWMLALQHPPAFCHSNPLSCAGEIPDKFKIHTLLPMLESWKAISIPKKKLRDKYAIDMSQISDLEDSLNNEWPQIGFGEEIEFWETEYRKHGYLTGLNVTEYFSLALKIKKKVDLLTGGGIEVSFNDAILLKGSAYAATRICEAVRHKLHAMPHLKCGVHLELLEVQVCMNSTTHKLMNCSKESSCEAYGCVKDNIVYASLP